MYVYPFLRLDEVDTRTSMSEVKDHSLLVFVPPQKRSKGEVKGTGVDNVVYKSIPLSQSVK